MDIVSSVNSLASEERCDKSEELYPTHYSCTVKKSHIYVIIQATPTTGSKIQSLKRICLLVAARLRIVYYDITLYLSTTSLVLRKVHPFSMNRLCINSLHCILKNSRVALRHPMGKSLVESCNKDTQKVFQNTDMNQLGTHTHRQTQ